MRHSSQNYPPSTDSTFSRRVFLGSWLLIAFALCAARLSIGCGAAPPRESEKSSSQICQLTWRIHQAFGKDSFTCPDAVIEKSTQEKKKRKHPLARLFARFPRRKSSAVANPKHIAKLYPNAFSNLDTKMSSSQSKIFKDLSDSALDKIPDLESRSSRVPWSGPGGRNAWKWWGAEKGKNLLLGYLRIMKWPKGESFFPFSLCKDGCAKEVALAHSLEFREKYKPWCISPGVRKENRKGFVYVRGYSSTLDSKSKNMGGHSIVWLRGGIHACEDPIQWIRVFINALDRAVADNLYRTGGKVGKFNTVIDGTGFSVGKIPNFRFVKSLVKIMQDHFPDRLGVILLINFSRPAQMILGFVKQIISKEVRAKLIVVPNDEHQRQELLESLIEKEFIPKTLGGTDDYEFDAKEYYGKTISCTNEESTEYLTTMPYHA